MDVINWLSVLERVESIKLYKATDDNMYYAEVYYNKHLNRPDLNPDYNDFSGITFEELVIKVSDWLKMVDEGTNRVY